ncbi:MAG: hypothetical protein GC190_03185 [Alphaproteobacteria bacterium]|nr:hypothetical protein [Alphaproteobacteria bacterium]
MRFLVVTGADEAYASYASDLITSLEHGRSLGFDLGLLDYGLAATTRESLARRVSAVVAPPWPYRPKPPFDTQIQSRAFATRPFLPDYFPGYDGYAWIDADSLVQDVRAIVILKAAASRGMAGVVPTVDRSYLHTESSRKWVLERYRMAFDEDVAQRLMTVPYIASGVVSAAANSPLWRLWRERFQQSLEHWRGERLCDQSILNHVVYLEKLPHHRLPSFCNWISHLAPPMADIANGALVEPSYPRAPIWIVANSFNDKDSLRTLMRTDGRGTIQCALTLRSARNAIIEARKAT